MDCFWKFLFKFCIVKIEFFMERWVMGENWVIVIGIRGKKVVIIVGGLILFKI